MTMMWKETTSTSRTKQSRAGDPGNTPLSMEVATNPDLVLPVAEPAAAVPVETPVSTRQDKRESIAAAGEYKIVMSCHVEQGNSPPRVERETASPFSAWIHPTGGKRGNLQGR